MPPLDPDEGKKIGVLGVFLSWLRGAFGLCPADVDEQTVTFHARAWVMHMFGTILFSDGIGDCASWMYLSCLSSWAEAEQYSRGSAVLAFLYHQMCEACQRSAVKSGIARCVYLL